MSSPGPTSLLIVVVLAVVSTSRAEDSAPRPCRSDPRLVGECFRIHGRLRAYNGNPTFRIWRIGTTRILGVADDEHPHVPPNLASHLSFDREIFGDYLVCPFTPERPGWMRMVCVESAERLVVRSLE